MSRGVSRDQPFSAVSCFTIDVRERPECDALEVILTGDLDGLAAGRLDNSLRELVDRLRRRHVVVDVADVTRLESSALEILLRVRSGLAADRRTLVLRGQNGVVRNQLEIAGLLAPTAGHGARVD